MSRILRRPMFRGGKVIDSRGTGITSGLMDGGRVGYNQGKLVTGGDLNPGIFGFKFDKPLFSIPTPKVRFGSEGNINFGQSPGDLARALSEGSSYRNYLESLNAPEEFETELTAEGDVKFKLDEKGNKIPIKKDNISLKEQIEKDRVEGITDKDTQGSLKAMGIEVKDDGTTEFTGKGKKINTGPTGNKTIEPEISAKDAIRENAELFKELLGEASKEDIKKARIQDASDYLLKFFAGTQKEGADVGSAAADVAEFATSRDSRTDRAKEAQKKTDQTAVALAINDYVAGKRSKEDIQKAFAIAAGKAQMLEGSIAKRINADAKGLPVTVSGIQKILREEGKPITVIPKDKTKEYQITKEDEGTFIVEEETKNVFEIINGQKVQRY